MQKQKDIFSDTMLDAVNEMVVYLYTAGKRTMRKLFKELTPLEYEILMLLAEQDTDRLYLSDIADKTGTALSHVSRIARLLNERRLVLWKHDGDGQKGTYIQITEEGTEAGKAQKEIIRCFFRQVITGFGENDFEDYLKKTHSLGDIMQRELTKMEERS